MKSKRALSLALLALSLGASPLVAVQQPADAAQPQSATAWSQSVWQAAADGDSARFARLLDHRPTLSGTPEAKLSESIAMLETNIAAREEARETKIAEAREKLEESLAKGDEVEAMRDALRQAVTLQMLMGDGNDSSFSSDPQIAPLVAGAERAARKAEAEGRWLDANEMWYRLNVLFEKEETYKADVRRAGQRLVMISLYAPERWWAMRNEQRLREEEEPLPPFNAKGTSSDEKLSGIKSQMVFDAVNRAASFNVHDRSMSDMLKGGLAAIGTMAQTKDLYDAFPGLADDDARERLLAHLSDESANLTRLGSHATSADLRATMRNLLKWNKETVNLPEQALLHEFGNGAMSTLDEFSSIIWPDELRRFERNTRGAFIGVGIQIQLDERSNIKVVTPLEDTPAQRAGVRAGDVIKAVDGESALGFTLDQAVDVITGPRDTPVTLTLEREGPDGEKMDVEVPLIRKKIPLYSVKGWERTGTGEEAWNWFIDPEFGIGYVRLTNFNEKTARDFDKALRTMKKQGLESLILDLRFNPGGLLDQAVAISSRFIDADTIRAGIDRNEPVGVRRGVVVSTHDKNGDFLNEPETIIDVLDSKSIGDIPVVVLVNQGSASASEIVSGAIQDYANAGVLKAIVLGQTSYGKGSVQNVWPVGGGRFSRGNQAALKLTTQYYRLPGGRMIHRKAGQEHGVQPNLVVDMLPEQLTESLLIRRDADVIPMDENGNAVVDEDRPKPWDLISEGHDVQLETAMVLLQTQNPMLASKRAVLGDGRLPNDTP